MDKEAVFVALDESIIVVDVEKVELADKVGEVVEVAVCELVRQGTAVLVVEVDTVEETVVKGETVCVPVEEELRDPITLTVIELERQPEALGETQAVGVKVEVVGKDIEGDNVKLPDAEGVNVCTLLFEKESVGDTVGDKVGVKELDAH